MTTNKRHSSMKFVGGILLMISCALPANAQFLRTSYFMEDSHYRMQLNPSLMPTQGYINIPVVGAFNVSMNSNSLGYQDIKNIIDNSDSFYEKPDFMKRLKGKNNLNVNLNTDILSAGWYKGQGFWSVNVGLRTYIGANITKSMFTFLNEMDAFEDNWRNSSYDISNQKLNINSYAEVGLGYARQINSRLTVGGKVKALFGVGDMNLEINEVKMNAKLPDDERIKYLQNLKLEDIPTIEKVNDLRNEINAYHANLAVSAHLESSFKGMELSGMEEKGYIDDFKFKAKDIGIAGYGLGIDLGASYKIMDNLTVSASILDLGFISWSKNSTQIANANPEGIHLEGSDYTKNIPTNPNDIINDPQGTLDIIKNGMDQLQKDADGYMDRVSGGDVLDYKMLQLKTEKERKSRQSRLASTFVVGAEYGILDNKLGFGVLSTTRFLELKTLSEITLSANYRPKSWLNLALSYSAIQSAGKSFGFGLKIGPVFLGTDYMFFGNKTKIANGFIGISIPLGGKKVSKEG